MEEQKTVIQSRLLKLREVMESHGVDVYYVPSDDFHGSEFVSPYFKVREYLSGFTGSAGTLIVTKDEAGLFTDGRYFLQAEQELRGTGITLFKSGEQGVPKIEEYLFKKMTDGMTLGFDGRCITATQVLEVVRYFEKRDKKLCLQGTFDLAGEIWKDRPSLPDAPAYFLSTDYCGETTQSKLSRLRTVMEEEEADSFILTSLDDIAWLLNIRGSDVGCSPLVLAYLVVTKEQVIFYCGNGTKEEEKLAGIYEGLTAQGIIVKDYFAIYTDKDIFSIKRKVIVDLDKVNFRLYHVLPKDKVLDIINPTTTFKAVKNPTEIANQKKAHLKDAVAYARFLHWFKNLAVTEELTELAIAARLRQERERQEGFVSESFEPIVAYKEHGAIVHYSPSEASNGCLRRESFVLLDTGAQYYEGTTDITRTLACGVLRPEEKRHYTLVLKANLALGNACFLAGTTGAGLDMLARKPLWENFMDYNHGTGHGVGYFSNVHEGPNSIRYRVGNGKNVAVAFEAGMITSNEPGLYLTGQYGIRLENMMVCVERASNSFGKFLGFDTLTLVPFELGAIEPALLTEEEKQLLNRYHARIFAEVSPYLNEEERDCLKGLTRPIP